jgi:DNA polymerase III sliding clamp (beta) subunit (PCNA family)
MAGSFISTSQHQQQPQQQKGKVHMKEIVLPVMALKEALPGLSKIVSKRTTLPVLQSVRVARDAEGKVTIMATDLDGFATYTAKEPLPGPAVDMLVPLDQLAKTVKSLGSEGTIGFMPEGKDKVKLRYSIGGSLVERSINSLPAEEFPAVPTVNQLSIPLEPGFGLALRQALECCSSDPTRYILNGVCLDVRDQKFHYIVGADGRCLFSANSFCFDLKKYVVIPDSKFLKWPDLLDEEPASLSAEPGEEAQPAKDGNPAKEATAGWVKLQSGRWTFITKEILGEFPYWKAAVPETSAKWTRVQLSDTAIRQLLLVIPSLPGDDSLNRTVRLRVESHQISVEGQNRDDDTWTSVPIQDVKVTGQPVTVGLNRTYLTTALRFGLNELEVEAPLSPVLFSNGGKRLVVMPVRLDPPAPVQPSVQAEPTSEATQGTTPAVEQTVPQQQPGPTTEERTTMPENTSTLPPRGNLTGNGNGSSNGNGNGAARKHEESDSALSAVTEKIDAVKASLRQVITELTETQNLIKAVAKEKRATEKEVESVRTALRSLQKVEI